MKSAVINIEEDFSMEIKKTKGKNQLLVRIGKETKWVEFYKLERLFEKLQEISYSLDDDDEN